MSEPLTSIEKGRVVSPIFDGGPPPKKTVFLGIYPLLFVHFPSLTQGRKASFCNLYDSLVRHKFLDIAKRSLCLTLLSQPVRL
jgi:hypothetical protein